MSKVPHHALSAAFQAAGKAPHLDGTGLSTSETARCIAEFTAELAYLARRSNLDLLAYLLDMARLEAARAMEADKRRR